MGGAAAALVGIAIFFDILSLIPFVNILTVFIGEGLLAIFFRIEGVSVFSAKKALPYLMGFVAEAIPAISMLPALTVETIVIIYLTHAEDKVGVSVENAASIF